MRYLALGDVLVLYYQVMENFGGALGIRDLGALESALAQPRMTFGGRELYPSLADKAAALGFSLVMNHPFIDGNKQPATRLWKRFLCSMAMRSTPGLTSRSEWYCAWRRVS